jgi:hypothetical protein
MALELRRGLESLLSSFIQQRNCVENAATAQHEFASLPHVDKSRKNKRLRPSLSPRERGKGWGWKQLIIELLVPRNRLWINMSRRASYIVEASHWLSILIENSPSVDSGKLSNMIFNQKLTMCGKSRIFEYDFESKTRREWVVTSFRIWFWIENSPCVGSGEFSNMILNRKLAVSG